MPKTFKSVEERRAYWKQWYENNKHREDYKAADRATKKRIRDEGRVWYHEYKKSLQCAHCGIKDFRVLDFHHSDPEQKSFGIAAMVARVSKEKFLEEVSKCIVLCANCHRIEHYNEKLVEDQIVG